MIKRFYLGSIWGTEMRSFVSWELAEEIVDLPGLDVFGKSGDEKRPNISGWGLCSRQVDGMDWNRSYTRRKRSRNDRREIVVRVVSWQLIHCRRQKLETHFSFYFFLVQKKCCVLMDREGLLICGLLYFLYFLKKLSIF